MTPTKGKKEEKKDATPTTPLPLRIKEQNPNNKIKKGEKREGQKGIHNKVIVRLKFAFLDKSGKLFTKNELGRLSIK